MSTRQYDNYADLITFSRASNATYLDSDGLIKTASSNVPRIEYDADGNRLGLLVEEARTNLLTYSEEFDNAAWTKSAVTVTADNALAPDGTLTADKLIQTTSTAFHYISRTTSVTAESTYTHQIYLKAGEYDYAQILAPNYTNGLNSATRINLSAGTILANGHLSTIEAKGNGWFLVTTKHLPATSSFFLSVYPTQGETAVAEAGDGTSGIYIWGAQLEAGAFPTSYIPTAGATATRSADDCSIPVSAFGYNKSEGTMVVEATSKSNDSGERIVSFSDGTSTNQLWLQFGTSVANVYTGGAYVAQMGSSSVFDVKQGFAFENDDFVILQNGAVIGTDSAGSLANYSVMHVGGRHDGLSSALLNGHIKSIKYYPRRLTNAQLQELTS